MGKKIFVSYKYADTQVEKFPNKPWNVNTTPRDYVDKFEEILENQDDIYKGESDGVDLSNLSDETIAEKLKNRIYDSSVTIVFVSKGMKELHKTEKQQWIPWEISYSLKAISRGGRTSQTNAILAVILPDLNGSYDYYMKYNSSNDSTTYMTGWMFPIMGENMFNQKSPSTKDTNGRVLYYGHYSYIHSVNWVDFLSNYQHYIDIAVSIFEKKEEYIIKKELEG